MTYKLCIPVNPSCPRYRNLTHLFSYIYNQIPKGQFRNYTIHIKEILGLDFDENTHTFTFENQEDYVFFILQWLT